MRVDYETDPIPATKLSQALQSLERLIGIELSDQVRSELAHAGIDLSDRKEYYFLHELREGLELIFGAAASEILIERIRKDLADKNNL